MTARRARRGAHERRSRERAVVRLAALSAAAIAGVFIACGPPPSPPSTGGAGTGAPAPPPPATGPSAAPSPSESASPPASGPATGEPGEPSPELACRLPAPVKSGDACTTDADCGVSDPCHAHACVAKAKASPPSKQTICTQMMDCHSADRNPCACFEGVCALVPPAE